MLAHSIFAMKILNQQTVVYYWTKGLYKSKYSPPFEMFNFHYTVKPFGEVIPVQVLPVFFFLFRIHRICRFN